MTPEPQHHGGDLPLFRPLYRAKDLPAPDVRRKHNRRPTSRLAARVAALDAPTVRQRVLEFVRMCGVNGAANYEIAAGLGINPDTAKPRAHDLWEMGELALLTDCRIAPSGTAVQVWVATEYVNGRQVTTPRRRYDWRREALRLRKLLDESGIQWRETA